jgi:uncharacterized protein involved in outer membrane biogenesis
MNNVLLYLGGLLVVVLSALFAGPHFVDWNSYRGVFEEEASRVLGRDVRVGGAVSLRLLPVPYVSLEKLKIADPDSETGDSLLRAESFTAWLSVPPLLKGVVEANKIEIKKPVLQLVSKADGKGNWQNLSLTAGHIPFLPQDVSLQAVHISDGTIVFGTAMRPDLARVSDVNGELSAEAINGPYKFNGALTALGVNREVKISTAAADSTGSVRYKANVNTQDTGNTLSLSGSLAGVSSQLTFDGDLIASMAVPPLSADPLAKPMKTDVTGKLTGDTRSFELKDMSIGIGSETTPQTISGAVHVSWQEQTEVKLALNSKLLDIDRINGAKAVPLDIVRDLANKVSTTLDGSLQTEASIALDQVTLGGEALSGVRFKLASKGGPLEFSDVKASMPGGARAELSGSLSSEAEKRSFKGQLTARGQSLLKFLNWGTGGSTPIPVKADGPFMFEGGLGLSSGTISFTEASAEIAGTPLTGEVNIGRGSNSQVTILVEGDKIDAGLIWPGLLDPAFLTAQVRGQRVANGLVLPNAMRVRLRAAELHDGDRHYKNVEADVVSDNGQLSVPRLKLTTSEDVGFDLEGETSKATVNAGKSRLGIMRGTVRATSAKAVAALARDIGLRQAAASEQSVQVLAPLVLAGALEFGSEAESALSVTFDGSAGAARLSGTVKLDGGLETAWTEAGAGLTLSADSPDIVTTSAALLALRKGAPARIAIEPKPGHLSIVARSGARSPVLVRANLAAAGLAADIDGRLSAPQTDNQEFTGTVRLKADDARHAMALAGLHSTKGIGVVPLEGVLALSASDKNWNVSTTELKAGEQRLAGTLTVANAVDDKPGRYSVDVDVQSATVPGLLAFITTDVIPPPPKLSEPKPVRETKWQRRIVQPEPLPTVWPLQGFDAAAIGSVPGTVKARFSTLEIEPGLALRDVEMEADIAPGQIDVTRLDGTSSNGEIRSKLKIEKSLLNIALKGTSEFVGGKNSGTFSFTGSGAAPAEIVANLIGKGELALEDVTFAGNSPAAIEAVSEGFAGGKNRNAAGLDVEDQLVEAVRTGSFKLAAMKVPLAIESGIARLGVIKVEMPEGLASNDTTLDLKSLKLDSQWKIEPRVLKSQNGAERVLLAPVTVAYSGKLKDLATLEPQIVTTALERELVVRRMERNVEELERLRKIDEAKAAEEKERRAVLEAQRIKELEAKRAAAEAARAAAALEAAKAAAAAEAAKATGLGATVPPGDAAAAAAGAKVTVPGPAVVPPSGQSTAAVGADNPTAAAAPDLPPADQVAPNAGANPIAQPTPPLVQRPLRRKKPVRETWKPFSFTPYE